MFEDAGRGAVQRLADGQEVEPGSAEELVVGLLRAQKPYRLPLGRRQRVRAALVARHRRRRAPLLLRSAVTLTIVICGAAVASAGILGWPKWIVAGYQRLAAAVPHSAAPPSARARAGATRPLARAPVEATAELEAEPENDAPPPPVAAPPAVAPRPAPAPAPTARRREPVRAPGSGGKLALEEDDSPVLAALRALRRAHDPVRARALLDAYLREHPDGTLAEEALAITIEAATAHHDADATALAARYLKRYPSGPFRALARRTLGLPARP